MLKLKLQYFGHLMQRANSLVKIQMLGPSVGRSHGSPVCQRQLCGTLALPPSRLEHSAVTASPEAPLHWGPRVA